MSMTNTEYVLEVLDEIKPKKHCDDCLSKELDIKPRQQVNQICNRYAKAGKIIRTKDICDKCGKEKISNQLRLDILSGQKDIMDKKKMLLLEEALPDYVELDIEKIRTQIVRICRKIWAEREKDIAPRSISNMINELRKNTFLPDHQASMMLTLCSLRNLYVYEGVELGRREIVIAANAWKIVSDWWNRKSK